MSLRQFWPKLRNPTQPIATKLRKSFLSIFSYSSHQGVSNGFGKKKFIYILSLSKISVIVNREVQIYPSLKRQKIIEIHKKAPALALSEKAKC